jgi:hypothetical protein
MMDVPKPITPPTVPANRPSNSTAANSISMDVWRLRCR